MDPSTLSRFATYSGPSMNPTLLEPELIEIAPYGDRAPRPGDVICIRAMAGGRDVVHRIVAVTPRGLRSRGDNNAHDDGVFIQPGDVVGQVVAVQRGQVRRTIWGGRVGLAQHFALRLWRRVHPVLLCLLRRPYRALARSGLARAWLPARWQPGKVLFQNGSHLLLLGSRVIGRYDPRRQRWIIRRPFRLFVDEDALAD